MEFSCTAQQVDTHLKVTVVGDVDLAIYPLFQAEAESWAGKQADVVLDCSGVTFLDSMGLRVLVQLRNDLASHGRDLVLADPSEPVRRVLELAGVQALFPKAAADQRAGVGADLADLTE